MVPLRAAHPRSGDVSAAIVSKASPRVLLSRAMAIGADLIIIGNGAAAAEAVLAARANGYDGEIQLFADNRHAPYNPMLGTYLVAGKIPLERAFPFGDEAAFYGANRVTAHLGEPVIHLDAEARGRSPLPRARPTSTTAAWSPPARGRLCRPYRGSGRRSRQSEGRRVFTIQTLDDALALKRAVDELRAGGGGAGRPASRRARPSSAPRSPG